MVITTDFDYDDNENNNKNLFCTRANVRPNRAMKHGNEIQAFAATGYSQNGGRFLMYRCTYVLSCEHVL